MTAPPISAQISAQAPFGFFTSQFMVSMLVILIVIHALLGLAGYSTYLERKISAYIQDRIGPNRVGFDLGIPQLSFLKGLVGLGQPLADGLKMFLKEDFRPKGADVFLFTLAPIAFVTPALIGFAVIPWGGMIAIPEFNIPLVDWTIPAQNVMVAGANINIGIVYLLAVASLSIYGITLAGWASNNKYSFLGGLRASAQMISYEIPMGLSILTVLLMTGSLLPQAIIDHQTDHGWLILSQPLAAALFFVCILAETSRTPFDNTECEQELVGGYHTEYSAMRFGLFPLSEYMAMAGGSAFFALMFLGGYHLPLGFLGVTDASNPLLPEYVGVLGVVLKPAVFFTKVLLLIGFIILIRWTIPRLRFDQVMQLAWQGMIPLALIIVLVTSVLVHRQRTDLGPALLANAGILLVILAVLPLMPRSTRNRRVRMYGSRFYPIIGQPVQTRPTDPNALEDRPVQSAMG